MLTAKKRGSPKFNTRNRVWNYFFIYIELFLPSAVSLLFAVQCC